MAEITRVSPEELRRREDYMRINARPYDIKDPYTWSYPAKCTLLMLGAGLAGCYYHNMYMNRPWYFGEFCFDEALTLVAAIFPRALGVGAMMVAGYNMGKLRVKYNQNRDAYINHYMKLHPDDFERLNDGECATPSVSV